MCRRILVISLLCHEVKRVENHSVSEFNGVTTSGKVQEGTGLVRHLGNSIKDSFQALAGVAQMVGELSHKPKG